MYVASRSEHQFFTCVPLGHIACPVYHDSLPRYLSDDLERIQKRTMRTVFLSLSYQEALLEAGLPTLLTRRQDLTDKLFNQIKNDESHKLHQLLPSRNNNNSLSLRKNRTFHMPRIKTERLRKSFINFNASKV